MEETSLAVASSFRVGNTLRDNPMDITQLKLITESVSLLADPTADLADEGGSCSSSHGHDKDETATMEVVGDGLVLEERVIAGSDEDGMLLVEVEPSLGSSCLISVISDCSSICSATEDLSLLDSNSETPVAVDAVKSALSSNLQIVSGPASGEVNLKMSVVARCDSSLRVLPILQQVVQKIPTGGESWCSLPTFDQVPPWGHVSMCGRRPEMEDALAVVPRFVEIPLWMLTGACSVDGGLNQSLTHLIGHFFGVYDGHGGAQVANYCREHIHVALAEEIRKIEETPECSDDDDCQKQWASAFTNCFLKVDAEIGGTINEDAGAAQQDTIPCSVEPIAPETVGSTAVVAVLCSCHIIVANCGDSRAVLCRGKQPLPLSVDHKPNREDEYARIEAAGGKVIRWNGYRVLGVLAMSRSIGDRYLKPWIIPEPEVICVPRMKEDDCLILASDGLWDVMSNEEVCDAARRRILTWYKRNGVTASLERGEGADPAALAAADYLSKRALQKGSKDNITVIVIDLKARWKLKKDQRLS
uniref:protein-serine/threonine phosphatase n=1 Tax=Anthurium amnicola TaxID=1678845 RepID=A0A1D1YAG8_9ARAE